MITRVTSPPEDATVAGIIARRSILHCLALQARREPEAPFITELSGARETVVTYGEFMKSVTSAAYRLSNDHGIGAGSAVAIRPRNTAASLSAICGVLLTGATAVIINPDDKIARAAEQARHASCDICISDDPNDPLLPDITAIDAGELTDAGESAPPGSADRFLKILPADPAGHCAIVIYTSGTTATSKGVAQSMANVLVNAWVLGEIHQLGPGKTIACSLPLSHVNGLEFTMFGSMIHGGHVLLFSHFDPFTYLREIARRDVRIASVVPSMLDALPVHRARTPLPSLRYFVSAAAPLSSSTAGRIWRTLGVPIVQGYGLSETTNFSTLMPTGLSTDDYLRLVVDADLPPVGGQLPGVEVAILDSNDEPVPEGAVGEICMRGTTVAMGYFKEPEVTRSAFRNGWFHSGDLGFLRRDAGLGIRLLYIVGRSKNVAKVNGISVSLDELDRCLRSMERIDDAVTISQIGTGGNEHIVVLAAAKAGSITREEIRDHLAKRFSASQMPRKIILVDRVPRTKTGKLDRLQAREIAAAHEHDQ